VSDHPPQDFCSSTSLLKKIAPPSGKQKKGQGEKLLFAALSVHSILLHELLNTTFGVQKFLFTGEEWMAL
jgi:hypothetical protein